MKDEIDELLIPMLFGEEGMIEPDGSNLLDLVIKAQKSKLYRDKQAILALKKKWETEAYKKGYIQAGIDNLTNGDK